MPSTDQGLGPGCATGEGAYSVSMLLLEEAARHDIRPAIQVFGSDLEQRPRLRPRGPLPAAIEADVSEDGCGVSSSAKAIIRVSRSCATWCCSPVTACSRTRPSRASISIACRNVLIYLDRELQELAARTFHYALNASSFLLLGSSETADHPAGLFHVFDRKARIYQSSASPGDTHACCRACSVRGVLCAEHVAHRGRGGQSDRTASGGSHRQAIEKLAPPAFWSSNASAAAHVGECRALSAAVRRSLDRRCRRSGAAGAAPRVARGTCIAPSSSLAPA